jgi:hypothetical protein
MIHEGRQAAFVRMRAEADREQVHGVVGVSSELRNLSGNSEFLFVGSGVSGAEGSTRFTSAGDAQELYCHLDARENSCSATSLTRWEPWAASRGR